MQAKFNANDFSKLINDATETSQQLLDAKENERKASHIVTANRNRATKSWNAVYEYLKNIAEIHKHDEGFKDSKIGELLIPQAVSWSPDKDIITEQTD